MKSIICTVVLLLSMQSIFAQKEWSLHDCIEFALENNLKLTDFKFISDSREESLKQSFRSLLPEISAYSDLSVQFGRSIDPSSNTYINTDFFSNNYRIEGTVDIFQGLKKIKSIQAAKLLFAASQNDVLHQKYMLAFEIMSAFFDVLYFDELLAINQAQLKISKDNLNLVNRNLELGILAGADVLEAKSTLLADSLLVTQSINSLTDAQFNLAQKMNLDSEELITLDKVSVEQFMAAEPNLSRNSLDSVYNIAKSFIPDIKSSELRVYAAEKDVQVARSDLYPTVSLFGGYGTGYFETIVDPEGETIPFNNQIKDNAKQLVGLSVNIPIFSGWSRKSNMQQKKIEMLTELNGLKQKKQELRQIIQRLILEQNALKREIKVSKLNIEAQDLAFLTAQKKYEKGLIDILEFYQAKNNYSKSLTENLLIKFNYAVNKTTMQFYNGMPVFKDLVTMKQ